MLLVYPAACTGTGGNIGLVFGCMAANYLLATETENTDTAEAYSTAVTFNDIKKCPL